MVFFSRKSRNLQQRYFIHIYSNGHTEHYYFLLKKSELGIRNVIIEPFFENSGNPTQMIKKIAKKYSSNNIRDKDKIFCVMDMDETTNEMVQEGLRLKESKFISLILSNPNFEIWFLLHFKHYTSKCQRRSNFPQSCRNIIPHPT